MACHGEHEEDEDHKKPHDIVRVGRMAAPRIVVEIFSRNLILMGFY